MNKFIKKLSIVPISRKSTDEIQCSLQFEMVPKYEKKILESCTETKNPRKSISLQYRSWLRCPPPLKNFPIHYTVVWTGVQLSCGEFQTDDVRKIVNTLQYKQKLSSHVQYFGQTLLLQFVSQSVQIYRRKAKYARTVRQ